MARSGHGTSGRRSATSLSRRLSYVLRHGPHSVGLTLGPGGWVDVDELLAALARGGHRVTRSELEATVRTSDKQRFAFDATGTRIRANQGHSVPVDLGLQPVEPPAVLYHGTVAKALDQIYADGLMPRSRHHVHLSADVETAAAVGGRRGEPIVLVVDAAGLAATGMPFYRSANGVWLVDAVPARFLKRHGEEASLPREGQPPTTSNATGEA